MRYMDYQCLSDSLSSEQQSDDSDISSVAPARRSKSSQKTSKSRSSKVRTLNRWTTEEHDKLAYLVDKWGSEKNWAKVAEEMPGRTGKQCRERWLNHMKPGIIKGNWSQEEEFLLAQCHALVGSHWSKMTKRLPGRTENSIKNFWNATLRSKAPNKKRGMLWTYMQLHDPKSDDNSAALTSAVARLHDSRELPSHLLAQMDSQLLDQRTWRSIHKAEKDYLENSGGDLHPLALPHPGTAGLLDFSAQQHAYMSVTAAMDTLDHHLGADHGEFAACGDAPGGLSGGHCPADAAAPYLHHQLSQAGFATLLPHAFSSQHHVVDRMQAAAGSVADAAASAGYGHQEELMTSCDMHASTSSRAAATAAMASYDNTVAAAPLAGNVDGGATEEQQALQQQRQRQHCQHTLADSVEHLAPAISSGSSLFSSAVNPSGAQAHAVTVNPSLCSAGQIDSVKYQHEAKQDLHQAGVLPENRNYSFSMGCDTDLQMEGFNSIGVSSVEPAAAGRDCSAYTRQHPHPDLSGAADDRGPSRGMHSQPGMKLSHHVAVKYPARPHTALQYDQALGGSRGSSEHPGLQQQEGNSLLWHAENDTCPLDYHASASTRRTADMNSGVAGGHGAHCSCGPCVNSRKLHGLHSPGARKLSRSATAHSSTRLRSQDTVATSSEAAAFLAQYKVRSQRTADCADVGLVAAQRRINPQGNTAESFEERGIDSSTLMSLQHSTIQDGAGYASAGADLSTSTALLGSTMQVSFAGHEPNSAGTSSMQHKVMQQPYDDHSPYVHPAVSGWNAAGALVLESPAAQSPRLNSKLPEQDLPCKQQGHTAAAALELHGGLLWKGSLLDRELQQQQQPPAALSHDSTSFQQQQQHQHQHQHQQLLGLDSNTASDLTQLQLPLLVPGLSCPQHSLHANSGHHGPRKTHPQGLDLSLALASPIGVRLGLLGGLEGLGTTDRLQRISVGQDLGLSVPFSCRQGVRLPSFGQIVLQRASVSALDWDWEALLMADGTNHPSCPSGTGEVKTAAGSLNVPSSQPSGVKRARPSVTSVDDDAALLIDMRPAKVVRGSEALASTSLYGGWIASEFANKPI